MSSNSIHSGMVTQIFTNAIPDNSSTNIMNYAVGTKVLHFNNDINNNGYTLNLSHDFNCYIPNTLVIHLYHSLNLPENSGSGSEFIFNICHLFHRMRLVLQISEQTVLQLPLSLLYELNRVEMHDRKLYIRIPFESLFNKINMIELQYSTISFLLLDTHEISNYANSFSLISKVYIHDDNERSLSNNNSSRRNTSTLIQQIGTLYMSIPNNQIVFNRRIFQIQTDILNGPTKGFLIQCHTADLTSIKFYINNLLRLLI
jgi:hypothetical protein